MKQANECLVCSRGGRQGDRKSLLPSDVRLTVPLRFCVKIAQAGQVRKHSQEAIIVPTGAENYINKSLGVGRCLMKPEGKNFILPVTSWHFLLHHLKGAPAKCPLLNPKLK